MSDTRFCTVCVTRQSVAPRMPCSHGGTLPARRTLSALTRPCALMRTVPSFCEPAEIVIGPPTNVPVMPCARTLASVNSTRPLACSIAGRSGSATTVLAANW